MLMSGSLAVFKLINTDKDKLMKKSLDSKPQQTFSDLDLCDSLGQSRSLLTFKSYDQENDRVLYNATHFSDTIKNPIRIYLDTIEDSFYNLTEEEILKIKKGTKTIDEYQEIHKFAVLIDFKTAEVFIFTNKRISHNFIRRFKKSGYLDYVKIYFDMKKIDNIPELSNIWGLWEDCTGRCKKKAYFGTEVHKLEGLNKDQVTSYNVKYEFDGENDVDLFIMYDCRLSSRSRIIGNSELFETYQEVKKHLGISEDSDGFREVFEEEN